MYYNEETLLKASFSFSGGDWEIDRQIAAAAAVMQSITSLFMLKKELDRKAKLSIPVDLHVSVLTYGDLVLLVMTHSSPKGQDPGYKQ